MNTILLSKKTKMEILEEYNQLLKKMEELNDKAKHVHDSNSQELIQKSRAYDLNTLSTLFSTLKASVNTHLNQLYEAMLIEVKKFQELQQASDLLRHQLEVDHAVCVSAEALKNLVQTYNEKTAAFTAEIENVKKNWDREKEEHEYSTKIARQRDQELYEAEAQKKEQIYAERERALKQKEDEIRRLDEQVKKISLNLEIEFKNREKELAASMRSDFDRRLMLIQKDWEAKRDLQDIEMKNVRAQLEKQQLEASIFRKEAELANKKAQELAVKIIEHGATAKLEDQIEYKSQR